MKKILFLIAVLICFANCRNTDCIVWEETVWIQKDVLEFHLLCQERMPDVWREN